MGKANLARLEECCQIVSLAPMMLFNMVNTYSMVEIKKTKLVSGTIFLPNLEFFSGSKGVISF